MILFSSMIWEWYKEHLVLQWNYKHLTFLTKELIVMSTKFKCSHTSSNIVPIHKWRPYGQVSWPILRICALHFTHPSAHTHSSEHTPGAVGRQCCGPRGAVGGLVPCSRVSPQSWYWGWKSDGYSLPPLTIPETQYPRPLGYESDSLSIRLPSFSTTFFLKLCQHTY